MIINFKLTICYAYNANIIHLSYERDSSFLECCILLKETIKKQKNKQKVYK